MPTRIAALMFLVGLPVYLAFTSGACSPTSGEPEDAALPQDHKVSPLTGGSGGGGQSTGGKSGGGGSNQGGGGGHSDSGNGGDGGKAGNGGSKDASAGGGSKDAGKGGSGGRKDAGSGGLSTIDGGPIACDDITSPERLAVYYYSSSAVSGSSIQMNFDIVNFTAFSSRMSQVTIRYWFTDENPDTANTIEQYYVPLTTTMKFIPLNPPRQNANVVLEMSYPAAAGTGESWVETKGFNFAFHKPNYAGEYNQANDYSYDSKLNKALGQNPKITAYISGVLSWGCEPPPAESNPDAASEPIIDSGRESPVDRPSEPKAEAPANAG